MFYKKKKILLVNLLIILYLERGEGGLSYIIGVGVWIWLKF